MINLESILKSRDITLPTKVWTVKAMVFPVIMYRSESWTVKKAECWITDTFKLWCWRRLLRVPWKINPEYSLEGLTLRLKLQYFGIWCAQPTHWKNPDAGEDWGQEEKGATEDEMVRWHHQLYGHEFEQTPGVGEGQGSLACCCPWGGWVGDNLATKQQILVSKAIVFLVMQNSGVFSIGILSMDKSQ